MNKITRLAAAATISSAALLVGAAPASAHVSIQEGEQQAGAFTVLTFGVPHGCEGSPTTKVEIQIPETILNVTPTRNPFYDVTVEIEDLAEPVTGSHGEEITTRDAVVVYTSNSPLADGYRDALQLSLQIPEDAAGTTLYFPTVQTCEEGSTPWIEIPSEDGEELEAPAPSVKVVEGSGDGHGTDDESDEAEGADETDDTEDEAAAPEADPASVDAAPIASSDDGTDPIAVIALVVGGIGLAVGAGGFMTARRKA